VIEAKKKKNRPVIGSEVKRKKLHLSLKKLTIGGKREPRKEDSSDSEDSGSEVEEQMMEIDSMVPKKKDITKNRAWL